MRLNTRVLPALGLLLLAGGLSPASAQEKTEQQKPATIQVMGTASATVAPDLARVSLAVESREKTAAAASQANATAMSAVLAALRSGKFEGLEIETYGYMLAPIYTSVARRDGSRVQRIDGYRAVNNVRATLTDLKAVGRLIDVATAAGANRVQWISFEASNPEATRQKVLAEAVRRAREQARTIATALDRELGAPLKVEGGAQAPSPEAAMVYGSVLRAQAETPIEAKSQTVTARVTITFALGPERTSR